MRHPQGGLYHTRWPRPGHTPPTCVLGMVSVKVLEDRQLCCDCVLEDNLLICSF